MMIIIVELLFLTVTVDLPGRRLLVIIFLCWGKELTTVTRKQATAKQLNTLVDMIDWEFNKLTLKTRKNKYWNRYGFRWKRYWNHNKFSWRFYRCDTRITIGFLFRTLSSVRVWFLAYSTTPFLNSLNTSILADLRLYLNHLIIYTFTTISRSTNSWHYEKSKNEIMRWLFIYFINIFVNFIICRIIL